MLANDAAAVPITIAPPATSSNRIGTAVVDEVVRESEKERDFRLIFGSVICASLRFGGDQVPRETL
jgi:hypothetical protein